MDPYVVASRGLEMGFLLEENLPSIQEAVSRLSKEICLRLMGSAAVGSLLLCNYSVPNVVSLWPYHFALTTGQYEP
ncbi:hypothetical protein M514_00459 [Trichuris suis]|uniref:Uncharacterized protein n=1 Tax=Trichuris suis TaxID=68888 RepID=A0A085MNH0_9BILA|nr:hypothetical protein M513_00459 [Trichuris suis]KFD72045.1 hypothetical protein M514_00459 [Trichuris suis]